MNFEMPKMTPDDEKANTRMHMWDLVRDAGLFIAGVVRLPSNIFSSLCLLQSDFLIYFTFVKFRTELDFCCCFGCACAATQPTVTRCAGDHSTIWTFDDLGRGSVLYRMHVGCSVFDSRAYEELVGSLSAPLVSWYFLMFALSITLLYFDWFQ